RSFRLPKRRNLATRSKAPASPPRWSFSRTPITASCATIVRRSIPCIPKRRLPGPSRSSKGISAETAWACFVEITSASRSSPARLISRDYHRHGHRMLFVRLPSYDDGERVAAFRSVRQARGLLPHLFQARRSPTVVRGDGRVLLRLQQGQRVLIIDAPRVVAALPSRFRKAAERLRTIRACHRRVPPRWQVRPRGARLIALATRPGPAPRRQSHRRSSRRTALILRGKKRRAR